MNWSHESPVHQRSWLSPALWICSLSAIMVLIAWQFEWFAEMPSEQVADADAEATADEAPWEQAPAMPSYSADAEAAEDEPSFDEIVAQQTEPGFEPALQLAGNSEQDSRADSLPATPEEAPRRFAPEPEARPIDFTNQTTNFDPRPEPTPAPRATGEPERFVPERIAAGNLKTMRLASEQGEPASDPKQTAPLPKTADITPVENRVPAVETTPKPTTEAEQPDPRQTVAEIDKLIAAGGPKDYLKAHKLLSTMYWEHPDWREDMRTRIEKTALSIYFSSQPHYMPAYEVKPNDRLELVGKQYKVPWLYLAALNKTDPKKIRPGQKLKVIKGPFSAVVDLSRYELTLAHHGFFVKRYKVGLGKDNSTPIGEFKVKLKEQNPKYWGRDEVIERDDPKNPLGEYWIDIGDSYGIHGTIEPDSIGKSESRGCVRMLNNDIAEVYRLLSVGSPIIIRR